MTRPLPLREFVNPTWFRGHKSRNAPLYFNATSGRWADPRSEFGVLYLGETDYCSFIEAFSQQPERLTGLGLFVSESVLRGGCLCPISVTNTLRLVDLTTGRGLQSIGADNRICDGAHDVSQRWSRAFWEHPSQPDGIYYRSRNAPELYSIALFDRARSALKADCKQNILTATDQLARILEYFECALLP
jgi:hypothetical protein